MKQLRIAVVGALALVWTLTAQSPETFKTRLAPVASDAQLAPTIAGVGSVSVTLAGTKLTVSGSFEGMRSAATAAHLQRSKTTGVPGIAIHDLTVSKAMGGTISGAVDLTPPEVEALRKGLLYVVVDSMGAPDGNLWGWLLK
jgi:hypothetical protein